MDKWHVYKRLQYIRRNTCNIQIRKVKLALEWAESMKKAVIIGQNVSAQIYRK